MDFDTFAKAIGAESWMLLDTDGIQYLVFLPCYIYVKQSCLGWRVEHQPTDDPADVVVITGGHHSPEAAMANAVLPLKAPPRGLFHDHWSAPCADFSLSQS